MLTHINKKLPEKFVFVYEFGELTPKEIRISDFDYTHLH